MRVHRVNVNVKDMSFVSQICSRTCKAEVGQKSHLYVQQGLFARLIGSLFFRGLSTFVGYLIPKSSL